MTTKPTEQNTEPQPRTLELLNAYIAAERIFVETEEQLKRHLATLGCYKLNDVITIESIRPIDRVDHYGSGYGSDYGSGYGSGYGSYGNYGNGYGSGAVIAHSNLGKQGMVIRVLGHIEYYRHHHQLKVKYRVALLRADGTVGEHTTDIVEYL